MIEEFWQTLTEEQQEKIRDIALSFAVCFGKPLEETLYSLLYVLSEDYRKEQMDEFIGRMGLVVR